MLAHAPDPGALGLQPQAAPVPGHPTAVAVPTMPAATTVPTTPAVPPTMVPATATVPPVVPPPAMTTEPAEPMPAEAAEPTESATAAKTTTTPKTNFGGRRLASGNVGLGNRNNRLSWGESPQHRGACDSGRDDQFLQH